MKEKKFGEYLTLCNFVFIYFGEEFDTSDKMKGMDDLRTISWWNTQRNRETRESPIIKFRISMFESLLVQLKFDPFYGEKIA